jgi:hypothetical protein
MVSHLPLRPQNMLILLMIIAAAATSIRLTLIEINKFSKFCAIVVYCFSIFIVSIRFSVIEEI